MTQGTLAALLVAVLVLCTLTGAIFAKFYQPGDDTVSLLERLNSDDLATLRTAVDQAGETKYALAEERLLDLAQHSDLYVRKKAIWALGELGLPKAVPTLMEAMDKPDVRTYAAGAIGKIGDPEAVPTLVGYLAAAAQDNGGGFVFRAEICRALGLISQNDKFAFPTEERALQWWENNKTNPRYNSTFKEPSTNDTSPPPAIAQ